MAKTPRVHALYAYLFFGEKQSKRVDARASMTTQLEERAVAFSTDNLYYSSPKDGSTSGLACPFRMGKIKIYWPLTSAPPPRRPRPSVRGAAHAYNIHARRKREEEAFVCYADRPIIAPPIYYVYSFLGAGHAAGHLLYRSSSGRTRTDRRARPQSRPASPDDECNELSRIGFQATRRAPLSPRLQTWEKLERASGDRSHSTLLLVSLCVVQADSVLSVWQTEIEL